MYHKHHLKICTATIEHSNSNKPCTVLHHFRILLKLLCEKETFILKDEKCFDSGTTAHVNDCNCEPLLKIDDSYISQVHEENRCENVQRMLQRFVTSKGNIEKAM